MWEGQQEGAGVLGSVEESADGVLPAAMSLMISYLSAITLLGVAAENYFYGITFLLYIFPAIISILLTAFIFVPLFYPLQITSIQEVSSAKVKVLYELSAIIVLMLFLRFLCHAWVCQIASILRQIGMRECIFRAQFNMVR